MPSIYHFTDGTNLEAIFGTGELRAHRNAGNSTDIADPTIKERRTRIAVPCGPGGVVADYVPFYFATRSPMLFSIKSGNVADVSSDQRRLVYFVSSTDAVVEAGLAYVITNGNASAAFTRFFDGIAHLAAVDWPLMAEWHWANTADDNDRRRRRGAEFLVHGAVPLEYVSEIGVYDAAVKRRVEAILAASGVELPVSIRRNWYF